MINIKIAYNRFVSIVFFEVLLGHECQSYYLSMYVFTLYLKLSRFCEKIWITIYIVKIM